VLVRRGPYAKTAARRAEILRAARESFAERGYAGSSLRDIAERAGTTHAVLQHHFAGKDELLMAVLAQRDAEEQSAGEREVENTFDSFATYLGNLLRAHQETPELMRLWAELAVAASRPDHPAHEYFVERYERTRTRIAASVRDVAVAGETSGKLDKESATTLLHALLNGLQIVWLLNPRLDIVTALNQFMELVRPFTKDSPARGRH
jgi:AcrR family transcriptional regulator